MITEYNKFLDFFRKKIPQMPHRVKKEENNSDIIFYKSKIDDIEDTLLDLSDRGYTIGAKIEPLNIDDFKIPFYNLNPEVRNCISIFIQKRDKIELSDVIDNFVFLNDMVNEYGMRIIRFNLYIYGYYDKCAFSGKWNFTGDIYYDDIPQLRRDRDLEATKNIEYIEITIVKT
jgi:hypothetical protein